MLQTIGNIVKEHFPALLAKWEDRPFAIISLILLILTITFGYKWWERIEGDRLVETDCIHQQDSLKSEIYDLKLKLIKREKYSDFDEIIDSTIVTLFKENLIKKQ